MGPVKKIKKRPLKARGGAARAGKKNKLYALDGASLPEGPRGIHGSPWTAYLLLVSVTLVVAGLMGLPNYHILLEPGSLPARLFTHSWILWAGLAGLVLAFNRLQPLGEAVNISRGTAAFWFFFFFSVCAVTRFYKPEEPPACYWGDFMVPAMDVRGILDVHDYFILFQPAAREPFFPYFTAGLWSLFPHATGVWIERLSSTLIDLTAIWWLYLLGSTLQGRRLGLILMAIWASSRPMIFMSYMQSGTTTSILGGIGALLFFFRLVQKPTLKRFIYWSLSLAFGTYCYVPFRPWPPIMITAVLVWVVLGSPERLKGAAAWILAAGLWLSWSFLFFYRNGFLHASTPWVSVAIRPWFLSAVFAVLTYAYFKNRSAARENEANRRLLGWATGSVLTALLSAPLMFHPLYTAHTSEASIFAGTGHMFQLSGAALTLLWSQISYCFGMMFTLARFGLDPYPFVGCNFFDAFSQAAMVVGAALCLARPSWAKALIVFLVLVGVLPFVLAEIHGASRISGAVAPLYLLAGWGLDSFWGLFKRETKSRTLLKVAFLGFLAFWIWDGSKSFMLCRSWMAGKDNDVLIGEQVREDWKKYYVLIAKYPKGEQFATGSLTMLCDQTEAYLLNDPNPVYLEPGEKGKDIVLLMFGYDQALEDRVKKEFPQARWSVRPGLRPALPRSIERVLIPFDSLSESGNKLIFLRPVPHQYWTRRFYCQNYGVARGLMWWNERVPSLDEPLPGKLTNAQSAKADGVIDLAAGGDYVFSTQPTTNVIVLSVDGKTIISLRPINGSSLQGRKKIHLEPGEHQISLVVNFRSYLRFPDIKVTPPGGGEEWILGKSPSGAGRR